MKILIADDDPLFRSLVQYGLGVATPEVLVAKDGLEAWGLLRHERGPILAILDWVMPGVDGVDICKRVHEAPLDHPVYVVLLTSRSARDDLVTALEAGADDFMTKPFDPRELRARVRVGLRMLTLQQKLGERVQELETALQRVKALQGLLPICSYCRRVRNDGNYWQQIEAYVSHHSDARFSHGICPDCAERFVRPQIEQALKECAAHS